MKEKCFIQGIGGVSAQGIWRSDFFDEAVEIIESKAYAQQPSYKELIAPNMIRRMSKGIKMGIYAAQQALDEAGMNELDAVITGTGLGCLEDSEKFLKNVLDNDEEFLTPTSFIQSTHNTVGAQIALRLGCKAYNFTYVNGAVSFESALLDSLEQCEEGNAHTILVGGIDEISGHTFTLKQLIGEVKADEVRETIRTSKSKGVNYGEGATFFALSNVSSLDSYAEVVDVCIKNRVDKDELATFIDSFLEINKVDRSAISALVLGNSGDVAYDYYFEQLGQLFEDRVQLYYKHLYGHSDIASAFGMATAAYVLKEQRIPENIVWKAGKQIPLNYVLLYNQYMGGDHSLVLLKRS
ncbi:MULTISPECIES: beta-ketoacyl synthase N-terminal-like domain-containing protein [Sphingobacterium]|uniref:beta-ketoacyl synthase N-terminal-like domain-containing protein n=1 Tax=Sphingobacterium TaxID=28453 RepID=UPI0013DA2B20|nr:MULTISPECIES: beta-ketoacyl synthase N-terminal-like domain-containing protein [unclassified Sphingobacterium]